MRRIAVLASVCAALAILCIAPAGASAAFSQCPAIYKDTSCQFLVTVTNGGEAVSEDSSQAAYEGSDDALVGVQNSSSSPVSSIHLSAETELFGFENDGICSPGGGPIPTGCVVQPEGPGHLGEKPVNPAGTQCQYLGEERGGKPVTEQIEEFCGFNPPGGEPASLTFPAGIFVDGFAANGDAVSGYEGPTSWFTNIGALGSFGTGSGTINFSPAIAPGGSAYFSLESPPAGGFGSTSTLSTTLSGGGHTGASITVPQGTVVTDSAALSGANSSIATGSVSYNVYSDAACTKLVTAAGAGALAGGVAGASSAVNLAPGIYYWQASYGGDANNKAVSSACGSEVLTVQAATSTSTIQTGGGVIGASIPVLVGSSVTDQAHIAGALAATATGTVTYTLYRDKKCTVPAAPPSAGAVVAGTALPSAAVKPKAGTYYWVATYSGGGLNAASSSACGSEILIVSTKANFKGLPSSKKCASKRRFVVHPKGPSNLVKVQVFINGKLVKEGRLHNGGTTLSLVGLPKGTFKVEFVASTASGKTYEDTRTFHTCVAKIKHKRKK